MLFFLLVRARYFGSARILLVFKGGIGEQSHPLENLTLHRAYTDTELIRDLFGRELIHLA